MQQKIDKIANIVRSLTAVDHPGPAAHPVVEGDLAERFAKRLDELRGPDDSEPAVSRVEHVEEAARRIADMCRGVPDDEIIWQGEPHVSVRDYAVGITGASALIAATGSVVLELQGATDGYASLLVDRHIVVAGHDRLVPDLPTFYQRLADRCDAGERLPIQVCITGCSRTADIEKVLVVPAHGPRQIRVILCEAPVDRDEMRRLVASI